MTTPLATFDMTTNGPVTPLLAAVTSTGTVFRVFNRDYTKFLPVFQVGDEIVTVTAVGTSTFNPNVTLTAAASIGDSTLTVDTTADVVANPAVGITQSVTLPAPDEVVTVTDILNATTLQLAAPLVSTHAINSNVAFNGADAWRELTVARGVGATAHAKWAQVSKVYTPGEFETARRAERRVRLIMFVSYPGSGGDFTVMSQADIPLARWDGLGSLPHTFAPMPFPVGTLVQFACTVASEPLSPRAGLGYVDVYPVADATGVPVTNPVDGAWFADGSFANTAGQQDLTLTASDPATALVKRSTAGYVEILTAGWYAITAQANPL